MQPSTSTTQGRGAAPPPASSSASAAAALKGATLAFQAQQSKTANAERDRSGHASPNPPASATSTASRVDNGALRAATQAQAARDRTRSPTGKARSTSRQNLSHQGTGGSVSVESARGGHHSHDPELGQVAQRLSHHLSPPATGYQTPDAKASSASFIAATLAASRSGSPTPSPGAQWNFAQAPMSATQLHSRVTRRPSLEASNAVSSALAVDERPDTEPIQPTGSLISLFESKREAVDVDPIKRPGPTPHAPSGAFGVKERNERRQAPEPRPKPPPSVIVRAAAIKDSKEAGQWPADSTTRSPRLSPEISGNSDAERDRHIDTPTEEGSNPRLGTQLKRETKPPVKPRKPRSVSMSEAGTGNRASTPPPVNEGRRPVMVLVSPKPRKITRTPRLEPPQLPARSSATNTEPGLPLRRSSRDIPQRRLSQSSATSNDTFVSASSTQSPRVMSPTKEWELAGLDDERDKPLHRPSSTSAESPRSSTLHPGSSPVLRPTMAPRHPTASSIFSNSQLALDSLTNAIVASNLASARLGTQSASPRPPPLPAPRRQQRPRSPQHLQQQRTADSSLQINLTGGSNGRSAGERSHWSRDGKQRTGMLHTLRAPQSAVSDDEDARRRTHRTRKKTMHPLSGGKKHAHKEGSRRRWRDEVSVRERRRYEAVWASNRGLFLRPGWGLGLGAGSGADDDHGRAREGTYEAGLVANVVVRDIWSRSRLPADELGEVWELVDRRGKGALDRQEFVVGMWLIDQRLRGRKIPARVGESVWSSARDSGTGVVVPGPRGKGRR